MNRFRYLASGKNKVSTMRCSLRISQGGFPEGVAWHSHQRKKPINLGKAWKVSPFVGEIGGVGGMLRKRNRQPEKGGGISGN